MNRAIALSLAELTWQSRHCSQACLEVALKFPGENWNWRTFTFLFPDPEIVKAHIDKPWDWRVMSCKRYASLFFEFPEKDWDWSSMTDELCNYEQFVDMDFIARHMASPSFTLIIRDPRVAGRFERASVATDVLMRIRRLSGLSGGAACPQSDVLSSDGSALLPLVKQVILDVTLPDNLQWGMARLIVDVVCTMEARHTQRAVKDMFRDVYSRLLSGEHHVPPSRNKHMDVRLPLLVSMLAPPGVALPMELAALVCASLQLTHRDVHALRGVCRATRATHDASVTSARRVGVRVTSSPIWICGLYRLRDRLHKLSFQHSGVTDIAPLVLLPKLATLLGHSPVRDLSAFTALTNLVSLSLHATPVADISALSGLTALTSLTLSSTYVADASPLSGLANLAELRLLCSKVNKVSALAALAGLTALAFLDLRI